MAQFNEEDRKWLFDTMKAKGVDTGNYDEFTKSLGNKADREWYYQKGKEFGLDLGSQQDFDNMMYDRGAVLQGGLQQRAYPNGVKPTKPVNTPKAQPVQQPQQQPKQQGGYKPTWQEQWAFGITANQAGNAAMNATLPVDQRQANAETYNKKVIGQAPKLGKAGRVVEDNGGYITSDATKHNNLIDANLEQLSRDSSFNLARMEEQLGALFENRERIQAELDKVSQQWVDSDGYVHSTRGGDGTRYDELVKEYQDNERAINDIATNEQFLQYRENQAQKNLQDISKQEEQLAARREKAEDDRSFLGKFFDTVSNITHRITDPFGFMPTEQQIKEGIGAYGKELQDIAKEENILGHRRELVQDAQNLLNEYRYEQQGGAGNLGLVTAARNVWNTAAKKSTWDSGISEFDRNYTIMQAIMKQDNGQPLSDNEKALLNDWAYNNAVSGQYNDKLSGWAKAGMVTGESLPFMLEMALNPLSGLGEAATKKLTQYAIKRYGSKWVKDHLKSYVAGKVATKLATDVIGAYGMAGTSGIARTAADALRRETGEVNIDVDQNGDIIYNGIKQDTKEEPLMAFAKAFTNTGIENWSEMAGSYLGFLGDYFGKVIGKSVIGKAGREMLSATGSIEGVSLNKAQKFIYELAAGKGVGAFSQGLADFAKRTQWHGVGGEYLEEVMGNIANAATVGDMNFGTGENGVFNLQENIDTFCGVALMGGFMSALHTGGFVAHKINYNPDLVSAENSKVFGDELWSDIKTMIDNSYTDPRELNNALTYILRGESGKQYSPEEKKAVLKYTQSVLEKEGREMAEYQPRMASSGITEVTGEGGKKQWQVTSSDVNGDVISQQAFDSEEEAKAYEGELKMQQQKRDLDDYMSMSTKLSFSEANNIIDEFMASVGIDENSDAYDETLANINDPNTELGKQFQQFKYNKVIEKARASQAAIAQFEQDNGWTPGTVRWLSEQDPMQLDAEGLQMQDQARLFLEGLAYPPTEVHVEHEQQVGADVGQEVVEKVVSTEEPIYPDNNIGKDIQDQWDAAQAARQAAFDADENLKEEVERGEAMGLAPQEIIASLDWARPEQRQAMVDYYNAQAKYDSMVNAAAKKIDEEAANSRQRHTLKGTIDGKADLNNVYQITDGTNTYYLVSGDVTTNPTTGQITDSNSGLIIGLDDNGDFVQISDTEGYSVVNTGQSLAQFEEAERERLQQETTRVVMPNGPQMQPAEEQSGNQDNAGGEAGASTGTGANEPSAAAPVAPTQPVNPPAPAGGAAQPQQPAVTIESVTDKDGIKRYENGIEVDDAIADMIASGDDVNEIADASIAEAQEIIDKINNKQIKTRLDIEKRKNAQRIIDYYNNVKARWAEVQQAELPSESEENVNVQPEQPTIAEKPVSSQQNLTVEEQKQQRIAEAKAKYGELFDDDFTKANDVYELVSMWVGRKRNLAWDDVNGKRGLQKELGWTRKIGGDTKYIETLLAKKGEGMGVDEFAHMVWESPENDINGEKRFSTEEIKEALLDLLKSAGSKSDVVDYAVNTRIAQAEANLQGQQELAAEQQPEGEPSGTVADIPEGQLPFGMPTNKDFTNDVNETQEIQNNDVSLQQEPSEAEKAALSANNAERLNAELSSLSGQYHSAPIQVIDPYNMTEEEWNDFANELSGAFMSSEEAASLREYVKANANGDITPALYHPITKKIYFFSHVANEGAERQNFFHENIHAELDKLPEDVVSDLLESFWNNSNTTASNINKDKIKKVYREDEWFEELFAGTFGLQMAESNVNHLLDRLSDAQKEVVYTILNNIGYEEISIQSRRENPGERGQLRNANDETLRQDETGRQDGQHSDVSEGRISEQPEVRSSETDQYLQPRNAEEEQIVADVLSQLQQEIGEAVEEQNKARSELQKAQARESERATDMFGNDNALNQPGQLFDNSDMPIDQSVEGVERRTAAEREKLQEATNKLNQLQSLEERNSRVRGALDNHRRQTKIEEPEANTSGVVVDPMEAIEQAAQQFQQEQEEKKAYGADNKLVTQDRYEELKKRMKQKLLGQANMGFDPEIMQIGAEMAMFHIEAGARKFADYATRMINDLGDAIRPYLQGFYEAARRMPGMEQLRKEMDSTEFVDNFDVLSYDKQNDNTVNVNKQENNEADNSVSLQQETSEEVQRKAEDADKYRAFSQAVADDMLKAMETGEKPYKSIKDIRAKAKSVGLEVDDDGRTDILLQELVEDGLVSAARQYVNLYMVNEMLAGRKADEIRNSRALFDDIVKLYNLQPSITQRSSNRIKMQQYSTPLPMSFIADVFATPNKNDGTVLEPTAGNGMMVFAVPEYMVHANELDKTRLDNLRAQKFQKVTDQDATQPFEGDEQYDAIIANPPFGAASPKMYDGKEIRGLDEQIALNALSKMKDDGKAAIIIGGNMEYAPNGAIKSDKAFFTYLYDHYNVKGVIDMDGKLYQKQGTTYPTRMILIDGRRSEEERAQSKVYPPTQSNAPKKATTFDELYDIAEEIKNNNNKTNGNEILRTSTGIALPDNNDASGNTDRSGRSGQSRQNESNGERSESRGSNSGSQTATREGTPQRGRRGSVGVQQPGIPGLFDSQEATSEPQPQTGGSRQGGSVSDNGRNGSADVQGSRTTNSGVGLKPEEKPEEKSSGTVALKEPVKPKVEEKRELDTDKLSYRPHNTAFSLESVAPAAMVEAMDKMLTKIEKEHGNIDAFVTRELGYDSIEDMHNALAAEQVDSVAMAIYQMKHGQGMIIGDQTGVGKGRQMAALIRWACRQGKKPVFITQKADLFSDIYRDLVDIGSGELRPFIFNSDGAMVDNNGNVVHKPLAAKQQGTVFAGDKLPEGYDFAVLTYSQVNTGDQISQEEAKEAAKKSGERYQKKKKKDDKPKATPKATFLRALAKDNYMFLDESHTAAGKSNTGFYFQSILKTAKAVTFASATFAKRPDTMPMYALRTAMSKAKVKAEELIKIIENGGVTLQEIMSRALTQAGQMVRRERDMSDVKTDWKTVDDPETVKKARQNYDSTIEAFNAIIDFQKNWVSGYLDRLSKDLADVAASAGMRQGTEDLGISNVPFASKTYNYTKQLMLALKVDAIVDEVVKEIEAGRHPVIALENTMGSLLSEYSPGDVIEDTTFAASLLKGLKGVLRYTIKDEDGKEQQAELKPSDLGPEGEAAYHAVEDLIRESTSGIFISPLDAITQKLQAKGYKVGELTGRNEMAVLDENTGEYKVQRRTDKDKKKLARDFNSGALDVLILNKSASTGISLHASEKFSDQRQRTMIIAQPLADINDYMQMIGRIDRTGQVARGYYINLGLPVPAEGRFLMMLSTKLKSLNANTTTSQENESNDVEAPDLLNKYGSRVVIEYLRDNPDVYVKMGEPLKQDRGRVSVGELDSYVPQEDDARKITGYVALLPTAEQDAFYNDVVRRYTELIKYLNDTGSNDLKISVLPLRARTIEKQVSSEGADPTGDNPFAGHAYVEWVEMDVLKKPMKAAEVGKVIEQLNPEPDTDVPGVVAKTAAQEKMLNQRMTPRVRQILDTVEKEYQAKMDKEEARYAEAKAKAEEAIKEQTEKINNSKRTPEQKKEAIEKYKGDRMQSVEETHNNMVNKIEASRDRIAKPLRDFEVGDSYLVPDDLTTDTFLGASPAIFCGFKAKDEGITPSTTLAVFCTLDGRRKIEIKLSDWAPLTRIKNHTEQNWDAAHEVTLSNWDSQVSNETRKKGFIMTGNILQAFADAGQDGRVPGQLVTYTDIDGNVHDGILMGQHWEPSQLKGSTVPIKNRMEEIKKLPNGEHITSADGNVVIERLYGIYTVSVPKSKKVGGQYYEDKRLLSLADGHDFYPNRGQLRADIEPENIEEVVNILSDLGVQMKSDTQVHFDTETEMGQAKASGRRFDEDIESEENINNNSEGETSQDLFLSLQQKQGEEYNETVNKIGERVYSGRASLYGQGEKSWRGKTSRVAAVAEVISAEHARNTGANSVHEAPFGDRVIGTERKIEEWAKADRCWFNEEEIAKNSLGGKPISVRSQSKVYLSKDGKTVIKITNPYARNHYGMLAFLRNISVFNNLFPETAYTITGFLRDENGNFRIVMEQPFIKGKQYNEDEYKSLGIDEKVVKYFYDLGLYPYYKNFSNQVFDVSDIYYENVIVDDFGNVNIIDADVSLEPRFLITEYRDKAIEYEDVDTERRFDEDTNGDTAKSYERKRKNRIARHIGKLSDKLGTKSRTIVHKSLKDVPADVREHIERKHRQGKKVRGWYENGQIHLFLPDIDSEYQAEKTIWHETVAHHGLRELIGAENYDKLLKQLWLEHRDGEMGKWVTERMVKNGWNLNEAIDEYLAREAEKNPFKEPGLWQRLRWMLAEVLHKMGFATDPTISDIQYLFWASQNQLRENDPMGVIKQQAFLHNLEKQAASTPYVNMYAARPEDIENPDAEGAYPDETRYSEETDEETIERLEKEPKVKVYRAMSLIDGKLYPPMATKQDGSLVNPIELGKWEKSDEHPEKAVKRNGKWVFKLTKDNGKSLFAAYNPYIHTSTTMLNDQFSEAQNRPNLVVVECEVPESELTSGYKAEKAKDSVGKMDWKAGIIQGQLSGTREVILSRWDKPVRIVPTEEVAQHIADMIKGKVEVMPTNVVTPQQRAALEKLGVKFVETDNRGFIKEGENAGKSYSSVYSRRKTDGHGVRRFDEDIESPLEYSAKKVYDDRLNRVETVFSEAYQDAMVSLKTAQNAIAGDKEIPDSQNAYMAENLMHGKNKNEQDLYNKMFRDPLIDTINEIMNLTGMNWGDIDRYVYTKSGLERNREFFVRDWLEAERNKTIRKYEDLSPEEQDIYDSMAATIETMFEDGDIETEEEKNKKLAQALQKAHQRYIDSVEADWIRTKNERYQDLKDGIISFPEYLWDLEGFIRNNIDDSYNPSEHDYSGFRAMYGDENGEYNERDIIDELTYTEDMIDDPAADVEGTVAQLWEQINAATRYGLERYREAGMRSDEQIDRVEQMFHFYVPMRGFKEETGEDMYQYFTGKGREKSYIGGLLKHAKGRGSEAQYPISTIFAMSYKAISDCNQNLVNQKLYRLCQANPNDLVILSDSWAVFNETTGQWEESAPEVPEDASEEEVREITIAWEDDMRQLALENKAKKIKGKATFDYKPIDKKKQSEHIVDVRINGQPKKMIVTGNPRMAQALNGQLRFEHGHNVFSKWNAAIKNFMASLFTSYSPTFALRNMFRDWTHFRTMLGVREGHGYASQANKYYRQSLFKMVGLFKKYREGTLDESKEIERDFKDFMDNGGVTGFVQMQKIDDIQKQMEKLYKQQKAGKTIRLNNTLWDYTLGLIEAVNEGIENNARFATYRASRHYAGRTKARSAYDAKEITVNFNRKGAGGKTAGFKSQSKHVEDAAKAFGVTSQILGEGRIFFNATVQAIATTFKNFQNPDGSLNKPYIAKWAAKYALPPFMFGLLLPAINKALANAFGGDDDDEPYANLPEWTRRRNICIYIGNDNFITIPVGQELAAFLALGDIAAGNSYAPELKPVDRNMGDEIVDVMNTFSPVDISTKITKGGLMEDPISEVTGRTFSVLAPLVAVEQNLGWTGRPIYREDVYPSDKYNPEYQMVYQSTNPVMVGTSKLLNDISGGDQVKRGKIQVNPAIIQYLWEQYTGGPGKVFSNTISIGKDAKDIITGHEDDFNIRKVEGLKAFIQQGDDRTAYYRTQAKYRKYKQDADALSDQVSGYQQIAAEDPTAVMKLEEISKGEDFVRMQIVKEAEKSLSEINKAANKAEGKERKELRKLYNEQVKAVVDMLDEVGQE